MISSQDLISYYFIFSWYVVLLMTTSPTSLHTVVVLLLARALYYMHVHCVHLYYCSVLHTSSDDVYDVVYDVVLVILCCDDLLIHPSHLLS